MNLTTTLQRQVHAIEQHGQSCLATLSGFAEYLNRAHRDFWSKSDEELQPFLQALLDAGQLETLFAHHEFYATSTNAMLACYGSAPICNTGILRAFSVSDGQIILTQLEEP